MGKVYNVDENPCFDLDTTSCSFTLINGSIVTTICILGTVFSGLTIYCLIYHVKLPYLQNMFILNVAVSDVIIALMGIVRGLGIINPVFVGYNVTTQQPDWWCYTYTLLGNTLWMSSIPVLLPLTIDRFVALVFPLKYKQVIITRTCKIMISMTWIPLLLVFIYDMVCLGNKGKELLIYEKEYHRCVLTTSRTWKKALFTIAPFIGIILMYITMLFFVTRARVESRKLMIVSSLIIVTGLMANIPDVLLIAFKVNMGYKLAQVTTVTFWYINPILNPIIYFCSNSITQQNLAATTVGRKISAASSVMAKQARRISSNVMTKGPGDNTEHEVYSLGDTKENNKETNNDEANDNNINKQIQTIVYENKVNYVGEVEVKTDENNLNVQPENDS